MTRGKGNNRLTTTFLFQTKRGKERDTSCSSVCVEETTAQVTNIHLFSKEVSTRTKYERREFPQ